MVLVSIGLPVHDGENFLEEAIRSVLQQTFSDFELVISDNASTDRTSEICADYAASDPRVRYLRNQHNLGAVPNFNRVLQESNGKYFKWLAHDDRIQPRYIEATVAALESTPDAVLCNSVVEYIDATGAHLGYYRSVVEHAGGDEAAKRFAAIVLRSHPCVDVFGMTKRDIIPIGPLRPYSGTDKAFIAFMALRGRLLQLSEPLVQMREHAGRYARRTKTAQMKLAWHDSSRAGQHGVPVRALFCEYRRMIQTVPLSEHDRRACRGVLRWFWFCNWSAGRLATDLLSIPFPRTVSIAWWIKFKLFGAPGNFVR
jgi:glycosyltransferase involved in cell wall biosynthesis